MTFALLAMIVVVLGFRASDLAGVIAVAAAAVAFPVVTIALRLGLQAIVAVFRIAAFAGEIADQEAEIALNTAVLSVERHASVRDMKM